MCPKDPPWKKDVPACVRLPSVQNITVMCLAHYTFCCQQLLLERLGGIPPPPLAPASNGLQV